MFDNCKTCLFYDKEYDDICRVEDDELSLDGSLPDNHFCMMWNDNEEVIPKDVWKNRTKCPHYIKDTADE